MADQQTTTTTEPTYNIGETTYRLETLSWQQHKWLADHIFKGIDMHRLDYATIHDLLREQGPLMMAICLIESGKTRAQHSRLTFEVIASRAEDFAVELTGAEVAAFGIHFFRSCLGSPATLAMLTTGKGMAQAFEALTAPTPAPGASGSSAASSRSAAATSPSSESSAPSGDRPSLIPISGAASSEKPSTAPSLASAASSSPG